MKFKKIIFYSLRVVNLILLILLIFTNVKATLGLYDQTKSFSIHR